MSSRLRLSSRSRSGTFLYICGETVQGDGCDAPLIMSYPDAGRLQCQSNSDGGKTKQYAFGYYYLTL
jgi:hypothetical protein